MLDTDEAFALAVLVRASTQSVGDAAERAIAKLEQMVPPNLRRDIELSSTVIRVASPIDDVDSSILRTVSAACRASDELAVRYRDRVGRSSERRLLPHRVVSIGRRWYLVARDTRKPEWRTWRVDRIESAATTGHRFAVVDPPDAVALVGVLASSSRRLPLDNGGRLARDSVRSGRGRPYSAHSGGKAWVHVIGTSRVA